MLEIKNLTKSYGGSSVPAVDNLSLKVEKGEIFGFIGPNGAGKSTTIKCITGILNFSEGQILIDDKDLKSEPIEAKKIVGYVSDSHVIYDKLTGIEFVNFMCNIYGVSQSEREERLEKYLEIFELKNAINNLIKSYSHGMKQKLNIIGALIHEPKLWILDEPLTGLDPKSSYELKKLMREHTERGNSVFFSSHVLDVVEKICDRIAIIDRGKLITTCAVSELKDSENSGIKASLEEIFLKITEKREG